jgi:peptidoglycan/xylan/chitin deacetylase (PgdA/CDA1 family)
MTLAPFAPVPKEWRGAIRRVKLPPGRKLVALTFDMCEVTGEVTGYDTALVDYLRTNGIKATFFSGGKWMRSHPERTRQLMADPLFEIGNHAEAHRNLRLLSGNALSEEIEGPQRAYETQRLALSGEQCVREDPAFETIPHRLGLFRFPFGACNQTSLDAVNDAGLLAIQWDLSTGDPVPAQSAQAIANAMVHAKPGAIIIGHGNGRGFHTAEALAIAIPQMKAKGFEFVTVSELLAQGTPEISATCYDTRPGDTDKYDTFFKPRSTTTAIKPAEKKHEPTAPSR